MDVSWVQGAAAVVAVGSAALLGGMASRIVGAWRRRIRHRAAVVEGSSALQAGRAAAVGEEGVDARIVAYAVELSQRARSPLFRFLSPSSLRERPLPECRLAAAGLGGALSPAGYGEARVRLMLGGAVLGGAVGLTATTELAALLAVIGAAAGWRALPWAVKRRSCRRAEAMECDLSEMLDVVALGMRSGMSFDRSLDLYTGYFRTQLADAFRSAQRQWACGLASRPEALREVADSYASPLLARVIENIVRCAGGSQRIQGASPGGGGEGAGEDDGSHRRAHPARHAHARAGAGAPGIGGGLLKMKRTRKEVRHEEARIRCGKSSGCAGGGRSAHTRVVRRGALALGGHARPGDDRVRHSRRGARGHCHHRHHPVPAKAARALGRHRLGNKQPLGNERGQGTVEYAIVTAAFLCVIVAGAALWRALSQGLFVDHGLASASHHLAGAATWIADVLVF